jgi:cell division protease FtsH
VHARGKQLSKDVDFDKVARRTPGFTGADLSNLMNEAAILAARRSLVEISKVRSPRVVGQGEPGHRCVPRSPWLKPRYPSPCPCTQEEIADALERIIAGPEKKGAVQSEKKRRLVAYHEAGHALVSHWLNGGDLVGGCGW